MLKLVPKRIYLVLFSPQWMLNLTSINQSEMLKKFRFNWSSIYFTFLCWKLRRIICVKEWVTLYSLMTHVIIYNKNKSGPIKDPWGTPQVRFLGSEIFLSILTVNQKWTYYRSLRNAASKITWIQKLFININFKGSFW